MTADPRAALSVLVAALERHLELASTRRDPDDDAVVDAGEAVGNAFEDYADALFDTTGVEVPIGDDYDDDVDPRADEDAAVYSGLDDDEVDFDDGDDPDDADDADDIDDDDDDSDDADDDDDDDDDSDDDDWDSDDEDDDDADSDDED